MNRQDFISSKKRGRSKAVLSLHGLERMIADAVHDMGADYASPETMYIAMKDKRYFDMIARRDHYLHINNLDSNTYTYHSLFGMVIIPTPALSPGKCLLVGKPHQTRHVDFSEFELTTEPY